MNQKSGDEMRRGFINVVKPAVFITLISIICMAVPGHAEQLTSKNASQDIKKEDDKTVGKMFLELRKQIDSSAGIIYRPNGNIRHTLYMFSSTECSHCSHAAKDIKPLLVKYNCELKIVFCGFNDAARENAVQAVCRKLDLDEYNKGLWKTSEAKPESDCLDAEKKVARSMELSKLLQVHNVPTFFLETGQRIIGAKMTNIEEALKN